MKYSVRFMVIGLAVAAGCCIYNRKVEAAGMMYNRNAVVGKSLYTMSETSPDDVEEPEKDILVRLLAVDETKQDCIWTDDVEEAPMVWSNEDVEVKIDVQSKTDIKTISYKVDEGDEIIVDCTGEEENLTMVISESATDEKGVPVVITATDVDDKSATYNGWVRVDKELPVIEEMIFEGEHGELTRRYGTIYSNDMIRVTIPVSDTGSGIDEKTLRIVFANDGEKSERDLEVIPDEKGRYCTCIPTKDSGGVYEGYIKITVADAAGNMAEKLSGKIIYSQRKPVVSMDGGSEYGKWTNQDIKLHIRADAGTSGIKKVALYVAGEKVLEEKPDAFLVSYEHDLVVKDSAEKSTGYAVEVRVVDNCGNETKRKRRVFIDKEMPQVAITGVANGDYVPENVNISVDVSDISFAETVVEYVIERNLNGKSFEEKRPSFTPKEHSDRDELVLSQEGEYTIYAIVTDGAKNVTESERIHFCIDKTAPETAITGVKEGEIKNRQIKVKFICEENYYDTAEVSVKVKRTVGGVSNITEPKIFEHDRRVEVRDFVFSEEGEYEITVAAKDRAGNMAQEKVLHFAVDKTSPEITITGSRPYQQWDEDVEIRLTVKEEHMVMDKVRIKGTRTDMDGKETELALPGLNDDGVYGDELNGEWTNGNEKDSEGKSGGEKNGDIKSRNIGVRFKEDGVYRISVSAKDAAGNKESRTLRFLIDTSAPEITGIDQHDGKYYRSFEPGNMTDSMFKDLTLKHCALYLNGVEYDGSSSVTDEGKYVIRAEASDELGHKSEAVAQFIVDHTAPKVTFSGVMDGGVVDSQGEVSWETEDDDDYIEKVTVNGEEYDANLRNISYNTFGTYNIEVTGADKAGNRSVSSIRFEYVRPLEKFLSKRDGNNSEVKRSFNDVIQESDHIGAAKAIALAALILLIVAVSTVYMYRRRKVS